MLRPGRFDRHILTPVPDRKARLAIFKVHTKDMPLTKDVKIEKLADLTENYVGADIEALCREAAIIALRKNIKSEQVTMDDFKKAMESMNPTMTAEITGRYESILKNFKKKSTQVVEKPRYLG